MKNKKMIEIERKFLVNSLDFIPKASEKRTIRQGYLNRDPERTVRVRCVNTSGFLTIKGKSSANGMRRFEWEKEIPLIEAEALLKLTLPQMIEKERYCVQVGRHLFEVDVFHGHLEGLIVAEVELNNEEDIITLPDWIGKEVTGEKKYYNLALSSMDLKKSPKDNS